MRINIKKAIALLITFSVATFAQEKGTFTDTRDQKTYKTVKIGDRTWMAENLNYAVGDGENDGKCYGELKNGESEVAERGLKVVPLHSPAEIQANCKKYGRLYSWATAKTACPSGWRLPNGEDMANLISSIGGGKIVEARNSEFDYREENYMGIAALKLMAKGEWTKPGGGKPATCEDLGFACKGDDYGFAALPGGFCCQVDGLGKYPTSSSKGYEGSWWTEDEANKEKAYSFVMKPEQPFGIQSVGKIHIHSEKNTLLSVRCVKN